jgi:hypothetical protein
MTHQVILNPIIISVANAAGIVADAMQGYLFTQEVLPGRT